MNTKFVAVMACILSVGALTRCAVLCHPRADRTRSEPEASAPLVVFVGDGGGAALQEQPPHEPLRGVRRIVLGQGDGCALTEHDRWFCWGDDWRAYDDASGARLEPHVRAFAEHVPELDGAREVSLGGTSCALFDGGEVRCWRGIKFPLAEERWAKSPQRIVNLPPSSSIATGVQFGCAVTLDGRLLCWGGGEVSRSGLGDELDESHPLEVGGRWGGATLGGNLARACLLTKKRDVYCVGSNTEHALGVLGVEKSTQPVRISVIEHVKQVAVGGWHNCALRDDASVWCWGSNLEGQLAQDGIANSDKPMRVAGLDIVEEVVAGWSHSCARQSDGVYCWGNNRLGAVGQPSGETHRRPERVSGLPADIKQLAAGMAATCALLADTTIRCWGGNLSGELGDGTTTSSHIPVTVLR